MGVVTALEQLTAATIALAVPSDSTVLSGVKAAYVCASGNVTVTTAGGDVGPFAVVAGSTIMLPNVTKIKAATTATLLIYR